MATNEELEQLADDLAAVLEYNWRDELDDFLDTAVENNWITEEESETIFTSEGQPFLDAMQRIIDRPECGHIFLSLYRLDRFLYEKLPGLAGK